MSQVQELLAAALLAGGLLVLANGQQREPPPATEPAHTRSLEHRQVHRGVPPAVRKAVRCTRRPLPTARPVAPIVKEAKKHERPVAPIMKEAKKRERPKAKVKPKQHRIAALPSCAVVRREYDRMSHGQRWAAYTRATPEQVAHGRRCLQI